MRLPADVYDKVDRAKIDVFNAPRSVTNFWNQRRSRDELRFYCGWYWMRQGATQDDEMNGPFKTKSAAYRDAYDRLQLRWAS